MYRDDPERRNKMRNRSKERNARIHREKRTLILEAHGAKCKRCGFDDPRALQFDHIKGGGCKQQKELQWLKRLNWMIDNPDEIQVLCATCNWIKKAENNEQPPGPPRVIGND